MRNILSIVTLIFFLTGTIVSQGITAPRFEDFPVKDKFSGKLAPVNLSSPRARRFRTALRLQAKRRPDFAGHYTIAAWGCGPMLCTEFAIIDTRNGKVYFPIGDSVISLSSIKQVEDTINYRRNSRLIIFIGSMEINGFAGSGRFYCEWKNNELRLIRFIGKPRVQTESKS